MLIPLSLLSPVGTSLSLVEHNTEGIAVSKRQIVYAVQNHFVFFSSSYY
ncbi:hypothetical protein AB32_2313 [Escherichia coli 2-316-03_S1_C2]|nr:hypothetical protein AC12_2323 [Escherichia coli 2-005-03_S3_C2]KEJ25902.1 hypothetical protein AB03_2346 [Escherichia coli 2-316-03_S1_C1]KEJ28087.1 hypothetical protein AB32_2313 [Escherichia coli 2-316-03_S1_C2]